MTGRSTNVLDKRTEERAEEQNTGQLDTDFLRPPQPVAPTGQANINSGVSVGERGVTKEIVRKAYFGADRLCYDYQPRPSLMLSVTHSRCQYKKKSGESCN